MVGDLLKTMANGDGRYLLNMVETILSFDQDKILGKSELIKLIQNRAPIYYKNQESHFNIQEKYFNNMIYFNDDPNYATKYITNILDN